MTDGASKGAGAGDDQDVLPNREGHPVFDNQDQRTVGARGPGDARELRGRLARKRIPRTNDYQQAGERYRLSEQWEKDDVVANVVGAHSQCDRPTAPWRPRALDLSGRGPVACAPNSGAIDHPGPFWHHRARRTTVRTWERCSDPDPSG
jgi:Catalase-related immune-responsive